ncbi:MAG: S8 family serine peptidase [Acidobacteriota bacterium]
MSRQTLFVSILLSAIAGPALGATTGVPPSGIPESPIHPSLAAQLDEGSGALHRIHVGLRPDAFADPAKRSAAFRALDASGDNGALDALRADVAAVRSRALAVKPAGRFEVLFEYKVMHGFSARADTAAIRDLARRPEVESIESMPIWEPFFNESHPLTGVDQVHSRGYTGAGVTAAIIDGAIDHDHAAFGGQPTYPNAKILGGYDFADDDADPTLDCDLQRHGSSIASILAGNGGDLTGTAPDAKLVYIKLAAADDCGILGYAGDLTAGIDWVVDNRATFDIEVLSLSLGFGAFDDVSSCESSFLPVRDALQDAYDAGIVITAAAGNDGLCNAIAFPACLPTVISASGAYDDAIGERSYCVSLSSCRGEDNPDLGCFACTDPSPQADQPVCLLNTGSLLDVFAPTRCAKSIRASTTSTTDTRNCFGGTSAAAPFVAGVAATLLEAVPSLTADEIRDLLIGTGDGIFDSRNGRTIPRVNADAALDAALNIFTDGFESGSTSAWTSEVP